MVETGLAVDPVHDSPPDRPRSPKQPRKQGEPTGNTDLAPPRPQPKIMGPNGPGSCSRPRLVALAVGSSPLRGHPCARSSEPAVETPEVRGALGKRQARESSRERAIERGGGRQENVALDSIVT